MPPKARKKLGYNWRARQGGRGGGTSRRDSVTKRALGVEVSETLEDSNALILPPRPKSRLQEAESRVSKRKRLSAKQKKRLMKILEVKEKKRKVRSY